MTYQLVFSKQAQKDTKKIVTAGLKQKVETLLSVIAKEPLKAPCKKLVGNLNGAYSRRINIQHRVVYQIIEEKKVIKILRMWTHYEK